MCARRDKSRSGAGGAALPENRSLPARPLPSRTAVPGRFGSRDWLICAGLGLLTLALFFPNTGNEFSSVDDNEYVADAPMVLRGLTLEGVRWAFTSQHFFNWLPVTTLSHMLDVELYGVDPF